MYKDVYTGMCTAALSVIASNWTLPKCLLLLLLSRFSRVRLFATPETAAHQAPPSLGFSRQEHWSGLPFPSQMHESEKGKWSRSVMSKSYRPHGLQPSRVLRPWDLPGKSTRVGCHSRISNMFQGSKIGKWNNIQKWKWRNQSLTRCCAVLSCSVVGNMDKY